MNTLFMGSLFFQNVLRGNRHVHEDTQTLSHMSIITCKIKKIINKKKSVKFTYVCFNLNHTE
jgi:hypothetical protein